MIVLSFNYKSLANSSKKLSIKRLVDTLNSLILFMLEPIFHCERETKFIYPLLKGWYFSSINGHGRSRGLIKGWEREYLALTNSWAFPLSLGHILFLYIYPRRSFASMCMDLIQINNVFGRIPYTNHGFSWV